MCERTWSDYVNSLVVLKRKSITGSCFHLQSVIGEKEIATSAGSIDLQLISCP